MKLLGIDLGQARTGVAFGDDDAGFVVALETIHHSSTTELVDAVSKIVTEKKIGKLIVGLPRLPGGEEGEQSAKAREAASEIGTKTGLEVVFLDERYTTGTRNASSVDTDAKAACELLNVYVSRNKAIDN